jgi:hypothetical protein
MPLFIAINLALCFFAQTDNAFKSILLTPLLMDISLGVALVSVVGTLFKKTRHLIWYDLFSSAVLLVWFADWQSYFKEDSPMFFFYPLYYSIITALVSLYVINARDKIDKDSLAIMQSLVNKAIIQPWVIMLCLFLSLEAKENFMLFPTLMTLFLIRYSLASYLKGR